MSGSPAHVGPLAAEWTVLLPLFREINDLKRVRSPELQPSMAGAWFGAAARTLFHSSADTTDSVRERVAARVTADVVAATRLGAISAEDLLAGGIDAEAVREIRAKAIHERRESLDTVSFGALLGAIADDDGTDVREPGFGDTSSNGSRADETSADETSADETSADETSADETSADETSADETSADAPGGDDDRASAGGDARGGAAGWIERLVVQPRAGATAPGRPRIVLEPVESCAEHCLVTAAYAVLLAPTFGAAAGDAFAIGLAHHLHNAYLPDAGFAGEALIGEHLDGMIEVFRKRALATMSPDAATHLEPLLVEIASARTPLARTFHAADTIDRVLQIEYFARCNGFTLEDALLDMELVHAGPVQAFQQAQLDAAGLGRS